ncbi:MAG: M48 family metallopeptidase [Planctomycetes bacterium]|nr:M48 family metallopeptidase [Planctomycetota bacterium]
MRRPAALLAIVLAVAGLATGGCLQKVEGSNRTQFNIMPDDKMNAMGGEAYQDILSKEKRSQDAEAVAMVERVGKRLAAQVNDPGFAWEFTLLESDQVNAFCLPGGKVAIYTGILSFCQNEAGLAAVMGHEIAHAIAKHGGERMSQGVMLQGATTALAMALEAKGVAPTNQNLLMTAVGAGAQVGVMLPFSRSHETEADYLGLIYMAKSGYDPQQAVEFWQRFATLGSGGPEFLSTHPASEHRASDLKSHMNQARAHYDSAPERLDKGAAVPARYLKAAAK